MSADHDNEEAAVACLRSWTTPDGDVESARSLLDPDMTFRGPLGRADGANQYIAGLAGLSDAVDGAEHIRAIANGDDVCLVYDLVVGGERVPTVGWYHFSDGRIDSVRAFFDPRPMLDD